MSPRVMVYLMARLGFSAKAISSKTSIRPGAVYYRLRKEGIKIKDYRDARSVLAKKVLLAAHDQSQDFLDRLRPALRKQLEAHKKI